MPIAMRPATTLLDLPPLAATLVVRREESASFMARLQGRSEEEMQRRFDEAHRAYVAWYDGVPAAWGWVATQSATIGELNSRFAIGPRQRYLWNFVTAKSHRGLGIYPRLLEAIVRSEAAQADEFWIAYAPENRASGSGISKAGFVTIAELSFDQDLRPAVQSVVDGGGAVASRLLGLPEVPSELALCWKCVRNGKAKRACASGNCCCDYQRPDVDC
jgi:GNAT superfamily N-acetyltransferase